MSPNLIERLSRHGIQPSSQRLAIADYVLETDTHPSADEVWERVQSALPMLSRATVYNTLHLFAEKGLLRELVLAPGRVVFDPRMEPHHHFVDEDSGRIEDVEWEAVSVGKVSELEHYEVREYMVVMRGKKRSTARKTAVKDTKRSNKR